MSLPVFAIKNDTSVLHTPMPKSSTDSDVVELPLLLPRWQVDALETQATEKGMTTGQMLRRLLTDLLKAKPR